ncbi:hypothetical protein HMPREF2531_02514 [Bacteroides intestinalis]|uniref:Uncharacterized protein n=1 Tax=Bacteroides intestinalis TaxID=329854 RepID=A0A139LEZ9_9BACE|nr:hypothetical protein HMPREF2531_02514 [Bacteroides intestinalis]
MFSSTTSYVISGKSDSVTEYVRGMQGNKVIYVYKYPLCISDFYH